MAAPETQLSPQDAKEQHIRDLAEIDDNLRLSHELVAQMTEYAEEAENARQQAIAASLATIAGAEKIKQEMQNEVVAAAEARREAEAHRDAAAETRSQAEADRDAIAGILKEIQAAKEEIQNQLAAATEAREQAETDRDAAAEAKGNANICAADAESAKSKTKEYADTTLAFKDTVEKYFEVTATSLGNIQQSEKAAQNSATAAAAFAEAAGNSATAAGESAETAGNSATAAGESAQAAQASATAAGESAQAAQASATAATNSAGAAEENVQALQSANKLLDALNAKKSELETALESLSSVITETQENAAIVTQAKDDVEQSLGELKDVMQEAAKKANSESEMLTKTIIKAIETLTNVTQQFFGDTESALAHAKLSQDIAEQLVEDLQEMRDEFDTIKADWESAVDERQPIRYSQALTTSFTPSAEDKPEGTTEGYTRVDQYNANHTR